MDSSLVLLVRRQRWPIAVLVGILALGLMACGAGSQAPANQNGLNGPPTQKLSILETTPGFFDVPIYGMIHDGFAERNGLTLEKAEFFSGSGSSSQIFAGGSGDILFAG